MTDTQLVYVFFHLGLSSLALVNAPDVDAPNLTNGTVTEKVKVKFLREFVKKNMIPGDVTSLDSTEQLKLIFTGWLTGFLNKLETSC